MTMWGEMPNMRGMDIWGSGRKMSLQDDDLDDPNDLERLSSKITLLGYDIENLHGRLKQAEFAAALAAAAALGCFAKLMGWI